MPRNENKRQKKLARKNQKQKRKRQELARDRNLLNLLSGQIAAAAKLPLVHCLISPSLPDELRTQGSAAERFGTILVFGRVPGKGILMVQFLVDGLCLGVKDCYARLLPSEQASDMLDDAKSRLNLVDCSPAMAREIVIQARDYGARFGFAPPMVFKDLLPIFGSTESNEEAFAETFHFGTDETGRPRFVSGPNDGPERIRIVREKLIEAVGEGGFDVVLNLRAGGMDGVLGDEAGMLESADDAELDEELGEPNIQRLSN
ncbi:MAG: hypothetical protein AAF958_19230 [Planctomycetota bacterium]